MDSLPHSQLRHSAEQAVRTLQANGFVAFWAGGCVRDILLRRDPHDYDIATSAPPDEVLRLFPGAVGVGKSFGVVIVPVGDARFEVATFRSDHGYHDGRHPERVEFTDAETDAARRDFTINAMFFDPVTDTLHDFVGGRADLESATVRCVGQPADRFREDHLRLLRAVRFAARLRFSLDRATAHAIRTDAHLVERLSAERVYDELTRLLEEPRHPGAAIRLLHEVGLLQILLPEVAAMKGQEQPPEFHPEGDVFTHTVGMLDLSFPVARRCFTAPDRRRLLWAALLHDVGKPLTASEGETRIRFDGHASVGARSAEGILERLRASRADIDTVSYCIANHMRMMDVSRMRPSTLKRLVGAPTFPIEIELHRLDCLASHGDLANAYFLSEYLRSVAAEPVLPPPWITGTDILALGVPQGPAVGRWHREAYTAQLDGTFPDRDTLLEWLRARIGDQRNPGRKSPDFEV